MLIAIVGIVVFGITMLLFYTINNRYRKKGTTHMKLWFQSKLISGGFELDSTSNETFDNSSLHD